MANKNFRKGIEKAEQKSKPYYHGSATELSDDHLRPKKQYTHKRDNTVNAVFVTPDIEYAKLFAMRKCISGNGNVRIVYNEKESRKQMYFEKIADNIPTYFYIYTVVETPETPLVHDAGTEYYALSPMKIIKRTRYSLIKELIKSGCEIYAMDEPLNDGRVGKHHSLDLKDIIKHQSGNIFSKTIKTITDFIRY